MLANATASSEIIKAEGIARSRIIIANATREAIETIAALNPEINEDELTNLYLETLKDISMSGKSTFIITSNDAGQLIIPIPP